MFAPWERAKHAMAFTDYILHDLHMTVVEVDELWKTVKKARANRWHRN
jgi:hypothetical protein